MKKIAVATWRLIELQQGEASERYFHDVLQSAKESGKLPPWLLAWEHTEKWSEADLDGIDFIIHTDRGRIKINVKSSRVRAKQFEAQHRHDDIVAITVNVLEKPEIFLGKCISTISRAYRSMR